MLTLTIWRVGILFESLILFRGFRGKLLSKYPFFYTYIAGVLVSDSIFYFVYMVNRPAYERWSWISSLVMILGYGIILEVFRHALSAYPGAERFARITGIAVFGAIFCFVIVYPFWPHTIQSGATTDLWMVQATIQRDFWTVQAIFLFAIFAVVSYYGIPLGKNLKGMISGYGLCLGVTLITLALRSYLGLQFDAVWVFLQPFSYLVSLIVWITALWSFHPNPVPDLTIRLEEDYEVFVARTRGTLGAMRSHLGKAAHL